MEGTLDRSVERATACPGRTLGRLAREKGSLVASEPRQVWGLCAPAGAFTPVGGALRAEGASTETAASLGDLGFIGSFRALPCSVQKTSVFVNRKKEGAHLSKQGRHGFLISTQACRNCRAFLFSVTRVKSKLLPDL